MNPLNRSLISTASLLAFASFAAAQNSQPTEQSGSSLSGLLNNARYELGRGLTFRSLDGESSLTFGGQAQIGYSYAEDAGGNNSETSNWDANARLRMHGNSGAFTYFVQMDSAANANDAGSNLIDAWVGYKLADGINLRLGQQKMRSALSADTSMNDTDFETVTRSIATNAFAGARATGALVEGEAGMFNWHLGAMNAGTAGGLGGNQANDDTDMAVTAGFSVGNCGNSEAWSEGDLARSGSFSWIAGATLTQQNDDAGLGGDDTTVSTEYFGMKMGNGLAGQLELFQASGDDNTLLDATGANVQVSYTLAKSGDHQYGFVLRHSMIDVDAAADEVTETVVGINDYHHGHNLKTQLQLSQNDDGTNDNMSLDLLFTVVF